MASGIRSLIEERVITGISRWSASSQGFSGALLGNRSSLRIAQAKSFASFLNPLLNVTTTLFLNHVFISSFDHLLQSYCSFFCQIWICSQISGDHCYRCRLTTLTLCFQEKIVSFQTRPKTE